MPFFQLTTFIILSSAQTTDIDEAMARAVDIGENEVLIYLNIMLGNF